MMEQIISKPFVKEAELSEMKAEHARLEKEIAINIQSRQMKENGLFPKDESSKESENNKMALIIKINPDNSPAINKLVRIQDVPFIAPRIKRKSLRM